MELHVDDRQKGTQTLCAIRVQLRVRLDGPRTNPDRIDAALGSSGNFSRPKHKREKEIKKEIDG